jgi:NADH dehydrogenase [ubiquinone] 1 alpha subcomplex assembly factor 7
MGAANPAPVAAVTGQLLADKIARRIESEGPLSVAAFMALALRDPEAGYYTAADPIGAGGDFVTAPEISQIYGESIGVWCALVWERLGRPDPVLLTEIGPGSGTLAADLLRAAAALPAFRRALRLHLVEVSPLLRAEQQRRLGFADPVWHDRADDLPDGPLLLVANEFLDALPIRQLVRHDGGWGERMVALEDRRRFVFVDGPAHPALALLVPPMLRDAAPPGAIFEICPAALALASWLGARLAARPGAALFIDYGRVQSATGVSLQAVRRHRPAPLLEMPGTTDLSADVDFAAFAEAAHGGGAAVYGPLPQRRFLKALGAPERLAMIAARAVPAQRQALESGLERLLDPAQMGTLFKAMALLSPGQPAPPGLDRFADTE